MKLTDEERQFVKDRIITGLSWNQISIELSKRRGSTSWNIDPEELQKALDNA